MPAKKKKIGRVKASAKVRASVSASMAPLSRRGSRGKGKGRRLLLKFRVRPLVRMPRSTLFKLLKSVAVTGIVPSDLDVSYMEYGHARGRQFKAGDRLSPEEWEQFQGLLGVLGAAEEEGIVRFERPT